MPPNPTIYHITHLDNLAAIAASGGLVSDAQRIARRLNCSLVGMSTIKQRRLETIEVSVCPGTKVGEYVPFYFCPRSIMLYILYMGNHDDITYRGGQQPILHLEADVDAAIQWADSQSIPWAFTDRNAGTYFVQFYNRREDFHRIDWTAVAARDFRDAQVKEGKQAEFLTFGTFPWTLIQKIGTINNTVAAQVEEVLSGCSHQPLIEVERDWYF
ncbi:DUF4433 domain-containing protein [Leptolyngbya sp. PL-A3]